MGEVWRARDARLGRTVALKFAKADFIARFEREARAIAGFNHPNICTLHDVGPDYLVMELVEGAPLKGPLPVDKAVEIGKQILDALAAAHEKGLTHRDLKPANILLTKQGIKLLDFGLAKQNAPLAETDATLTQALTGDGAIVGTLQYMAPEQLQGKPADARSDLFSFGCILYELLSGRRAFEGENAASVIAAILDREPAPLDLHPPLERLIRRCLAKDPAQRFQTARDLRYNLELALAPGTAEAPKPASQLPWALAAATTLAAIVLGWQSWRNHQQAAERPLVRLDLEVGDAVGDIAVSPDGQSIAFVVSKGLSLRRLDTGRITPIAGTEGAARPFFSPDGKWLGFVANRQLMKVALAGGAPVALCPARAGGRGASWSPDGYIIASLDTVGPLMKIPESGGEPVPVTKVDEEGRGIVSHRRPQLLPGGALLFVATDGGPGAEVRVLPPGGGKPKTLVEGSAGARFLDSGHLVYYRRGTLFATRFDLSSLSISGTAVPVADGVAFHIVRGPAFDLSPRGTLAYRLGTQNEERTVAWVDSQGAPKPVLSKAAAYLTPQLSPDNQRLAVATGVDRQRHIWSVRLQPRLVYPTHLW